MRWTDGAIEAAINEMMCGVSCLVAIEEETLAAVIGDLLKEVKK